MGEEIMYSRFVYTRVFKPGCMLSNCFELAKTFVHASTYTFIAGVKHLCFTLKKVAAQIYRL